MSQDIKCPCCQKKTIAKDHDGVVKVWCRQCKQEVEIKIEKESVNHESQPSKNEQFKHDCRIIH